MLTHFSILNLLNFFSQFLIWNWTQYKNRMAKKKSSESIKVVVRIRPLSSKEIQDERKVWVFIFAGSSYFIEPLRCSVLLSQNHCSQIITSPTFFNANIDAEYSIAFAHEERGAIEVHNLSSLGSDNTKHFSFDAVFSEKSSQRKIYDTCAAPIVNSVLNGYNGTVFVYGQTGAGKVRRDRQHMKCTNSPIVSDQFST
jgi:hypothetical protein